MNRFSIIAMILFAFCVAGYIDGQELDRIEEETSWR